MMVSGAPMGSLELVPRLAWGGQWAEQPAQHGAVQQWHGGGVTPLGAGALDSLSAGTATHSHPSPPGGHRAVGGRKRGRRALTAAEGTPVVPADVGTNVTEGTLSGWRGTLELGTSEMGASELGTSEMATTKLGTSEMGASELGTSEMGTTKMVTSEMGTLELGTSEMATTKLGTSEMGASELGTTELGTLELGATKLGTSEMGTLELGTSELATTKLGTLEMGASELGTSELATTKLGTSELVALELETSKLGTSELATTKLGTSELETTKLGTSEMGASELGTTELGTAERATTKLETSELGTSELGTLELGASSSTTGTEPPPSPAETRGLGTTSSSSQPASSWVGTELPSSWVGTDLPSSPPTDTAAPSTPGTNGPSTLLPGSPGQPRSLIPASSTQTGTNHIPRHLTGDSTNPWPATGSAFGAMGSSYQPSNASATEGRGSDSPTTSTSDSITATKGGGRTFRSVPASTRLASAAEIPTSGTKTSSSSDQTWSPGVHLGAQGGVGRDAPGSLLTGSPSASEGTSTTFSSSPHPKSIPSAGELALHSDAHRAEVPSVAAGAAGSPASSITGGVTKGSATTTELTSSSWDTLGTWKHHSNSSREATDPPAPSGVTLPSSSLPASESTFPGVRSSHRPVISSGTEHNPLGSSPSSTVLSASSSILWAAGVSVPSSGTSVPSVRGTYGAHGSRGVPGFTKGVADPSLMSSHPPSEAPSPAPGSSHVPFSTLSTETRTHLSTASLSPAATKGVGRTFRSVPASTSLPQTTEISTPAAETSSSPDHSAQAGVGISATALPRDLLLTGVPSAAGSASPAEGSLAAGELPDAPLTSTPGSRSGDGNMGTSAPTLPHPSSSESIPLPSSLATDPGTRGGVSQRGAGFRELPTELLPGFSSSISVPSSSPSSSERGRRVSGAPTETVYVSTTLSSHKEGTSQAAAQGSMWSTVSQSPRSHPDTAGEPHTGPLPSSTAWPGAGQTSASRPGYPGPKVTFASRISTYFSSASEPSTVGSSSSTKGGMSSPITGPAHGSPSSAGGGERMLHSGVTVTVPGGTGSSSSHPGTSSPGSASGEQSGVPGGSSRTRGSVGSATETALPRSSKIPTYSSSFQSSLTSFSSSHQAASSIEAEKRTSVSHTDGTYISTTYTRGGERTLLSISNSSTSADSSESSTFFSDISSASDSSKSAVAQGRRSNASSAAGVAGPSTEPLLVHPSRLLTPADSTGNTTLFNADSEWLPTDTSPLSSSAFPASSSPSSSPHRSLSATPPTTYLFTTSKSPEPLSSSVVASWPPLQALSSPLPTSSLLSPAYSSLLPLVSSPSSVWPPSDGGGTAAATTRRVPSTAAVAGSSPRGTSKPGATPHPKASTAFTTPPWPTAPMEQQGGRVVTVLATAAPGAATTQRGRATPAPTTASSAPRGGPTGAPLSPTASPANHSVVAAATVKPPVLTTAGSRWPGAGDASTTSTRGAPTPSATEHPQTTGESTAAVDATTAKPGKDTEESIPVTSPSEAPPTTRTTVSVATTWAATKATTAPPLSSTDGPRMPPPATDVDKCLSNPCPALATCNNTRGSFICQCPLGYELEKGKCNLVRIFMGQVPLRLNVTHGKYAELLQVEGEILAMLNSSLSGLPGYHHSTVKATREANFVHVSVQSTFSLASNVTFYDVVSSVKSYIRACKAPTETCQFISSLKPLHRVGSLCKQKAPECDQETSECTDFDGIALCQCKSGYFKYNKMDHSCRACEDGYKLENETCVSCPFGLGGFNCGNPYQLITVVIAAAGGGLLLIMGIALTVTCCRKNKNDISKLIFKSGDFQMSPYAEYPKNPRAQEWGRETIEMQENGSTKNLLQMTDVYYSPTGLRNPELERNGLYPPYTGLPGSRHSCIYPGQYNPSFISDETRRRDYF